MRERSATVASEAGQQEVIAFLADPATHGGAAVERIDTHISHLFLAGDRAWKLKRAVRTNYLDFSTLERREKICRREIEVNRMAGGIYLGVTPVVRRAGRLSLGGPGEPVEWLVKMRRFDRGRELSRLCENGDLTLAIVERLADDGGGAASRRAGDPGLRWPGRLARADRADSVRTRKCRRNLRSRGRGAGMAFRGAGGASGARRVDRVATAARACAPLPRRSASGQHGDAP